MHDRVYLAVSQSVARFYNRSQRTQMSVTNRLWVQEKIDTYLQDKSGSAWMFRPELLGVGRNSMDGRGKK